MSPEASDCDCVGTTLCLKLGHVYLGPEVSGESKNLTCQFVGVDLRNTDSRVVHTLGIVTLYE